MKRCPRCIKRLYDEENVCPNCNADISVDEKDVEFSRSLEQSVERKKTAITIIKKIFYISFEILSAILRWIDKRLTGR